MKNLIVVVVMAMFAVALATPVSADEFSYALQNVYDTASAPVRGMAENLCDSHRGTGDAVEASWCHGYILDAHGRVVGYNPNSVRGQVRRGFRVGEMYRNRYSQQYGSTYGYGGYGYDPYGYGYGPDLNGRNVGAVLGGVAGGIATRNSRSGWVKAGGILGGAVLGAVIGDKVENRNSHRDTRSESISDCVKKTTKELRKAKVAYDSDQVLSVCSGRSVDNNRRDDVESGEVDSEAPAPEPPPAPAAQTTPAPRQSVERRAATAPSVYVQGDKLCNDTDQTIAVLVNGNRIGNLGPRQVVSLNSLPKGKIGYFPIG